MDTDMEDEGLVVRMYNIFETLNNTKDKSLVEDDYKELLTCAKKSNKEKRLASPFISRFIDTYPKLIESSIDALFDLCEDEDVSVRKQVIKDLVTVSGKLPAHIPKIADVYAQLMATSDNAELAIIHNSLVRLLNIDVNDTLRGLFWQIKISGEIDSENTVIIDRCLTFLISKVKQMVITVTEEKTLLNELKNVAHLLIGDDFRSMMNLIALTKIFETKGGRQIVFDIICELLSPSKDFDGTLEENIHKFTQCGEQIVKIVSHGDNSPGPFVTYCCTKVIPNLTDCLCHEEGNIMQFEIMKIIAEATLYLKTLDKETATKCLRSIYKYVLDLIPLPAEDESAVYNYKYSVIECYIFVLYKLCSFKTPFFEGNKEKLLDLRKRLQFFARVLMGYIKALKEDISGKDEDSLKTTEMLEKASALRLADNIYVLVKDFFRTPLICGLKVGLSWLPVSVLQERKRCLKTKVDWPRDEPTGNVKKYQRAFTTPSPSTDSPRRVVSPAPRRRFRQGHRNDGRQEHYGHYSTHRRRN